MNQRKMVNYIVREGKCLQYPGRELSLEEKKQRLYHYTSFNSFVRIWLTQTLKFGVVTDMNDMFEHNFSSQCHSSINRLVLQWTMILIRKVVCHQ